VHPSGKEIACGDKVGGLKVYDLATMKQIVSTKAHAAEILSLSYSPSLFSSDGGNNWSVSMNTDENHNNNCNTTNIVLLASAGKNNLFCKINIDYHDYLRAR
jgi:WD40 repeat protein